MVDSLSMTCIDMRRPIGIRAVVVSALIFTCMFLAGCVTPSESCPSSEDIDLSEANTYVDNSKVPFRFPVDSLTQDQLDGATFASYGYGSSSPDSKEYHAAEDYFQPAGSPVYAMADGVISFSGPMGGYGWLVIVDHPQLNLYSLYGHLSPSRWRVKSGLVHKSQLIAYLGDSDENGGSKENPLRPHLHFGIRSGQRADYPGMGEWRWMAGWIKYCPQDLGWLQPSMVINAQEVSEAGFPIPEATFLTVWWVELIFSAVALAGAVGGLLAAAYRRNRVQLILFSTALPLVTWYFFYRELKASYALLALCIVLVSILGYKLVRLKRNQAW